MFLVALVSLSGDGEIGAEVGEVRCCCRGCKAFDRCVFEAVGEERHRRDCGRNEKN